MTVQRFGIKLRENKNFTNTGMETITDWNVN